ncbi:MAG: hypothetical protein HXK63_06630 [Campylobacter sp.]|nr:hypothetical protein [Campylobacter sp.]
MFIALHLKLRTEVVSAGGRCPCRRIFIAPSQADGRRGGYKLRRQTAVATVPPFMRRLILVRHVFCAARGIALRRNSINLSVRRFLKFRIVAGFNCRLKFHGRTKCGGSKA